MSKELKPGEVYGKLTIIDAAGKANSGGVRYLCHCSCGNNKVILGQNISRGFSKSCGNCNYNKYRVSEDGKTVIGTLSDGDEFKFDIEDFEKVKLFTWYPSGEGKSNKTCINSKREYIHRYIMNAPKGFEIDHIDRNRMNNCKSNLRLCGHQQNQCNQPLQSNNKSGVTGVRFHESRKKYIARIKFYGKEIHLGYYNELITAIQARDVGAKLLFGEFAVLNDVPDAPRHIKEYVYKKCSKYIKEVAVV